MAKVDITGRLGLDSSKFERGIQRANRSVGNFVKSSIAKFGALAGVAGIGAMTRAAIDLGSKISDLGVQLNIGTTQLQVLDFASREAGVGTEILARALRNVQTRTEEAIKGNKSYGDAFNVLNINVEEFKKLDTEKKLEAIAVAQSKATDKAAAYNAVARILGEKAGPALQEVLQNLAGEKGFKGLSEAAQESGEVMSEETIAKMDKAADTIESFKRRMTVLTAEVLSKVVPGLKILGNGFAFIGDVVGVSAHNFLSFGKALGTIISAVVAPAISQMEALGLAIKAAGQFAARDFAGAKESITAAKDAAAEIIDEIKAIPSEISGAFDDLTESAKTGFEILGESIDKRSKSIVSDFKDIIGTAEKVEKAVEKADTAIVKSVDKTETQSGTVSTGPSSDSAATAAEPLAAIDDKIRGKIRTGRITTGKIGGFKSRFGAMPTMAQRERAAGLYLAGNRTMLGRSIKGRKATLATKQNNPEERTAKATEELLNEVRKNP